MSNTPGTGCHIWRPDKDTTFCGKTRQEHVVMGSLGYLGCLSCSIIRSFEEQQEYALLVNAIPGRNFKIDLSEYAALPVDVPSVGGSEDE